MIKEDKIFGSFSVNDPKKAKEFYGQTLGLKVSEKMQGLIQVHTGNNSGIIIYSKPDHVPATFTVLNLPVDDVEEAVNELTKKGVHFEIYHERNLKTDEKGILRDGGMSIAWFKDPAGNIISILEEGK